MGKKKNKEKKKGAAAASGAAKLGGNQHDVERLKFLADALGGDDDGSQGPWPDLGLLARLDSESPAQREIGCATVGVHLFQASMARVPLLCEFLAIGGTL